MPFISKANISPGVFMVDIPAANLRILCGCPPDCVKHLIKAGVIQSIEKNGIHYETGPNAILLSDYILQNESFANMAEFPVLQMLYRQGMLIPNHPNNTGVKPLLIGNQEQMNAQLNYIYRGNYGLISTDEMIEAGAKADEIDELMRIKLKFAFGRIADSKEFLDSLIVDAGPVQIRNGVSIERLSTNVYEFEYQGERVQLDLNLQDGEKYLSPIALQNHALELADFAIVHSGEGDGWDIERAAMSSIILYHGRIYLIDAGPSVMSVLRALGIGLNEIAGLFHTHSHDDHFAGLPDLIRSDRRLKYYATPLVRASVVKKLCALLSIDQSELDHYLDFQDLTTNVWNDIDGLEVQPVISPHPVETTILQFRVATKEGYRSYSHLADIASLAFVDELISDGQDAGKTSLCQQAKNAYLEQVDIKKIDIGGGLIHGLASDFEFDQSGKKILAHTALPLTPKEMLIGTNVPFATVDVLMPAQRHYELEFAKKYLLELYPRLPSEDLAALLSNLIIQFKPGENLLPFGQSQESIYLVLRGYLELRDSLDRHRATFSAGTVAGELAALLDKPAFYNHIAASYVHALKIPVDQYREIANRNQIYQDIGDTQEKRLFLLSCWLFEDGISYATLNHLVDSLQALEWKQGDRLNLNDDRAVYLIKSGSADLYQNLDVMRSIGPHEFFGEQAAFTDYAPKGYVLFTEDTLCYRLDATILAQIPVCRWKLLQILRRSR